MSNEILKELAQKEAWEELSRELLRRGIPSSTVLPYSPGDKILLKTALGEEGTLYFGVIKAIGETWLHLNPCGLYYGQINENISRQDIEDEWEISAFQGPTTFMIKKLLWIIKLGPHILIIQNPEADSFI